MSKAMELEKQWCEQASSHDVKELVDSQFPQLTEIQSLIMTNVLIERDTPISTILGIVAHTNNPLPSDQDFADVLLECINMWDMDLLTINVGNIITISSVFDLPPELSYTKRKFIPPMLARPRAIYNSDSSPYQVAQYGSHILGHASGRHDEEICYDILNTQNNIKVCIDLEYVKAIRDVRPDGMMKQNWDMFVQETESLIEYIKDDYLYFAHKVDKRGRLYCHGYHLNYQGNPWRRAIISLEDKHAVTGTL